MADISKEISDFQNAVYGEEVRSSLISLANKVNDEAAASTEKVDGFGDTIDSAVSSANSAASSARSAASSANSAASSARSAASSANSAASSANTAASSANSAASNAKSAEEAAENGESSRASAENARASAESTRQYAENARQSNETARQSNESARQSAESARATSESARDAAEASRQSSENSRTSAEANREASMANIQASWNSLEQQVLPVATANTLGGVKVGTDLEVTSDGKLSVSQTLRDSVSQNGKTIIGNYAGRDISTILAGEIASGKTVYDALHTRIASADYSGLRVGDYLDVPLVSASGVTSRQSVRFLIAHFDPYYQCGDSAKGHHIAFVASAPVAVSSSYDGVVNGSYIAWNTTATNQGTADDRHPYTCSELKEWETAFAACIPDGLAKYLLTQRVLLEERYSPSGTLTDSNGWSWQDVGKVWSPSETEVYGQCVFGTKGYGTGIDCQFDIFHDTAHRINGSRTSWWLRSVASESASNVCDVYGYGFAHSTSAAFNWACPRPCFLVG